MSSLPNSASDLSESKLENEDLPITTMVRAVCQAALAGPDLLYEVMLKLALMVESVVPTYGLSIWTLQLGEVPTLSWAEGLLEEEIATGEAIVAKAINDRGISKDFGVGDHSICF